MGPKDCTPTEADKNAEDPCEDSAITDANSTGSEASSQDAPMTDINSTGPETSSQDVPMVDEAPVAVDQRPPVQESLAPDVQMADDRPNHQQTALPAPVPVQQGPVSSPPGFPVIPGLLPPAGIQASPSVVVEASGAPPSEAQPDDKAPAQMGNVVSQRRGFDNGVRNQDSGRDQTANRSIGGMARAKRQAREAAERGVTGVEGSSSGHNVAQINKPAAAPQVAPAPTRPNAPSLPAASVASNASATGRRLSSLTQNLPEPPPPSVSGFLDNIISHSSSAGQPEQRQALQQPTEDSYSYGGGMGQGLEITDGQYADAYSRSGPGKVSEASNGPCRVLNRDRGDERSC